MATVLVADDDDDIRALLVLKLQTLGHDVVEVVDGRAAWDAAQEHLLNVAVLDVMMPHMTGIETLLAIRSHPRLARLPVLLLTAAASERDRDAGLAAGADGYLTKPFSPREVGRRVEELLERPPGAPPPTRG